MTEEIFTLKKFAEYLKLSEKTAYRLAADGKLPDLKISGSWHFRKSDIQKWIAQQKGDVSNGSKKRHDHLTNTLQARLMHASNVGHLFTINKWRVV